MADGHFAVNIEVSFSEELSDTCSSDATEVNICFCIPSNMYLLAMHKHTCTVNCLLKKIENAEQLSIALDIAQQRFHQIWAIFI